MGKRRLVHEVGLANETKFDIFDKRPAQILEGRNFVSGSVYPVHPERIEGNEAKGIQVPQQRLIIIYPNSEYVIQN